MIHALHAFAALTLAAGDHANLHPANVDVFIESSAVQAALKAYERAPLLQLLNDPAIAKIGAIAKEMGADLQTMARGVMPVADAARPDDRYWPWSAVTVASLSLSDVDAAPTTGIAPNERTSGWLVLDFKDAPAATQALAAIGGTGGVSKVAVQGDEPLVLDGHTLPLTRYEAEFFDTKVAIWLVQQDARLIGGVGRAKPSELVARLAHPETSFVEKHKAVVDDSGLKPACGATIVRAWSDLERVSLSNAAPTAETSLLDTFLPGFLPFIGQRGRYRLQLCGERFVSESITERIGAAKQLDELYGAGTVPNSTALMIPKDAVGAWLMKIDPAHFESFLETTLGSKQGAASKPADEKHAKLSDAVGDSAAVFMLPFAISNLSSGDLVPNAMMSIALKDGAAFKTGFETLLDTLRKSDPKLTVEDKPYHKLPMYTLSHRPGGVDAAEPPDIDAPSGGFGASLEASLHPTVVIMSDRILIAPNRKLAQAEVRRIESKPTEVHSLAIEGAIPKDAFEVSSMDWGALVGKLYDAARGFLPMLAQGTEKTIDVNALPTSAELFRFLKPSASYSTRVSGKTYTYSESSFGPETPLGIALFAIGVSSTAIIPPSVGGDEAGVPHGSTVVEPKAPEPAPKSDVNAQKDATVATLRRVKTGLAIYRSQFGRVPDTLDELLKGTEAFPKGFLDGNAVPKDGWGRTLVFSTQDKGATFALHSMGENGVDDHGAGDDLVSP